MLLFSVELLTALEVVKSQTNCYFALLDSHFNARLTTGDTTQCYARTGYLGFLRRTESVQADGGNFTLCSMLTVESYGRLFLQNCTTPCSWSDLWTRR